jgi:hypothetical protein
MFDCLLLGITGVIAVHNSLLPVEVLRFARLPPAVRFADSEQVIELHIIELPAARNRAAIGLFILTEQHPVPAIELRRPQPGLFTGDLNEFYLGFIEHLKSCFILDL